MIVVKIRKPYITLSPAEVEQQIKICHDQVTFGQMENTWALISETIGKLIEWNGFLTEV